MRASKARTFITPVHDAQIIGVQHGMNEFLRIAYETGDHFAVHTLLAHLFGDEEASSESSEAWDARFGLEVSIVMPPEMFDELRSAYTLGQRDRIMELVGKLLTPAPPAPAKDFLTVKEVAQRLSVSEDSIHRWFKGRPGVKEQFTRTPGKRGKTTLFISEEAFEAFGQESQTTTRQTAKRRPKKSGAPAPTPRNASS